MIKITLISALFWGLISSLTAVRQKRNGYLWFLLGSLFGAFGLGFLFFTRKKPIPAPQPKPIADQPLIYWYYLIGSTRHGPMSSDALKKCFYEDKITEETYLWNDSMQDWAKLKTLPVYTQLTT